MGKHVPQYPWVVIRIGFDGETCTWFKTKRAAIKGAKVEYMRKGTFEVQICNVTNSLETICVHT